ncbi:MULTISPECIES: EpsG family protein [Bacteroidaceae]|uniref:EpsG family protein n=5 Tax=Bacteroides TaxID=816 RepID=A0A7J0A2A1_9BACE|nr:MULTISPECIES: EpsG family protein [Bacteroidaceae]MBF0729633.1 EpsG family protein [Bacteroides acidifaciens]MBF0834907.1 EpsG family protein [Bacteroides acidifaciens]NDO56163.1 EpsG family protein [Bacteroides acidifaciens]TFU49926.1 EpsG family protein [Bacteroides acidifaciens]GFH86101.1 hypothetical protein IMSAGC001_01507 [Bacteroides acidifaciens]
MYFIFALIIYFAYKQYSGKNNGHYGFIKFVSIFFIATSALRHMFCSVDTWGYIRNLQNSFNKSWTEIFDYFWINYFQPGIYGKDPGYYVFEKALGSITSEPQIFFLILALLVFLPIYHIWRNYSASTFQTLVSALFYLTFFYAYVPNSAARQAIAIGFVLMAYLAYERKTKKGYILSALLVFVASLFHQSALIVLSIPIACFVFKKPKLLIYGSIVAFVTMLFVYQMVGEFLGAYNEVYDRYNEVGYYASVGRKPYLSIIFYALFFFIVLLNYRYETEYERYKILYVGGALSFVLMPILWLDPSAVRLVSYFGIWFSLLVPHSIDIAPAKHRTTYVMIVLAALFLRLLISQSNYAFFWQDIPMPSVYL